MLALRMLYRPYYIYLHWKGNHHTYVVSAGHHFQVSIQSVDHEWNRWALLYILASTVHQHLRSLENSSSNFFVLEVE